MVQWPDYMGNKYWGMDTWNLSNMHSPIYCNDLVFLHYDRLLSLTRQVKKLNLHNCQFH